MTRRAQALASSVVTKTASGASTVTTPRNLTVRRLHFKPGDDQTRALTELQTALTYMQQALSSSPLATCAVLTGIAAVAAVKLPVYHRLGRVPLGCLGVDATGRPWRAIRVPPAVGAKGPSGGLQEIDYLTMLPLETGTYTLLVF